MARPDTTVAPEDFLVETGRSKNGSFVRAVHAPTGLAEIRDPIGDEATDKVGRELIAVLVARVEALLPWPDGLSAEVQRLIDEVVPDPEIPEVPGALPVTWDLFSYVFLRADGTTVSSDQLDHVERSKRDGNTTLRIVVLAGRRYPTLAEFTPSVPLDAPRCRLCVGSGRLKDSHCPFCAGLGRYAAFRLPTLRQT